MYFVGEIHSWNFVNYIELLYSVSKFFYFNSATNLVIRAIHCSTYITKLVAEESS